MLTELMEAASEAGKLRAELNPRRLAAMTMQTVMFIAQSSGGNDDATVLPSAPTKCGTFARADSRPSARTLRVIELSK